LPDAELQWCDLELAVRVATAAQQLLLAFTRAREERLVA
jgi:hypothetical protein